MKNQSIIVIAILVLFAAGAIGYSFFYEDDALMSRHSSMSESVPQGMHRMPDGTLMRNAPAENGMEMMNGMDHSMMMVKSEREFLEGMIPHHQEAVDTAKEVLARGGSTPEIKRLAEDIIAAQEKEITMMKAWYQSWYGEAYVANSEEYEPMMRDLSSLSGAALDKVFLEDMIMHHMGAVMMAESVQPHIEHQEMADLTKAIVETQTIEIQLMRRLINEL